MRLCELLGGGGGGQVCICVQSMWQTRGSRGMLPREILVLDLSLVSNLVESGTFFLHKHNLPFIIKLIFSAKFGDIVSFGMARASN